MKVFAVTIALLAATAAGPAVADPWKDESGHGRWVERDDDDHRRYYRPYVVQRRSYEREYKQEFTSGGCKVERAWSDDGTKEEVKCDRRPTVYVYPY